MLASSLFWINDKRTRTCVKICDVDLLPYHCALQIHIVTKSMPSGDLVHHLALQFLETI